VKLAGGILYYSLLVIILSSSIVGLILLSSYYENRLLVNAIKQDELERNVSSSFNVFLAGEDVFKGKDSCTIGLFGETGSDVSLIKRKWGNYFIIRASSKWENRSYQREALIGSDISVQEPVALFMQDEGRFLSLSGNTILKGTCYLPGKTARIASIEGQQYIYKNPVFGEIKKSPPSLPELEKGLLSYAITYITEGSQTNDSIIKISSLDSTHLTNSFKNKTIVVDAENIRSLSYCIFKGNIVIWSTNKLTIDGTSKLEDVILIAPSILIKNGFSGTLQAFAVQSIIIEDNCDLGFPSQLCVIQSEGKYNPADSLIISIGKGSKLAGGAIIKNYGLTSFIKIDKGAIVSGQIYCPGTMELQGEVVGSLYCKTFYLGTPRARYYNHLLNTRIDYSSLSKHFVGIDLLKEISEKSIIKWLD
jgi:hypothetical protein